MNLPIQAKPVLRGTSGQITQRRMTPSGTNTQCCGTNCMTKYCLIGLSSKGCENGQPYINCISPGI